MKIIYSNEKYKGISFKNFNILNKHIEKQGNEDLEKIKKYREVMQII